MYQSKQLKRKSSHGHWLRVAVMFLSAGFLFPNAMTEDDDTDIAEHGADKNAKVK